MEALPEKESQELVSLSRSIRTLPHAAQHFHLVTPLNLWTRFFQLHIAKNKFQDVLFRPWKDFLESASNELEFRSQHSGSVLDFMNELLGQLNQKVKENITMVGSYQEQISSNQLSFIENNEISFSQEFLFEAVDYYTFWKSKFHQYIVNEFPTDIDILMLMESIRLFNEHHKYLEQKIIHWPLPLGCFYPKTNGALEIFLSDMPQPPVLMYNSIDDIENLGVVARNIIKEEYGKAVEYLSGYIRQIRQSCHMIFPTLEFLHEPFEQYREDMSLTLLRALNEIEQVCKRYETKCKFIMEDITEPCYYVEETLSDVKACGKYAATAKRRVRESLAKFLLGYYKDAKTRLKKDKKTLKKFQRRLQDRLGLQLKLKDRLQAYPVWKDALDKVINEVKKGKLRVLTNVYEVQQFYYHDFINSLPGDNTGMSFSQSVSTFNITKLLNK